MTSIGNSGETTTGAGADQVTVRRLQGSLGVGAIVFMVVAAAAPLTVVGGGVPIAILLGNGAGVPMMFVVAAVVLLLFAVGLSTMARYIARPGAFFTYVGEGLGRPMGLGTAYLALLTYTTVQAAVYGLIGVLLSTAVTDLGGPGVAWWVWSLAMVAITGFLGYRSIDLSSAVLGFLLIAEIGIVLILSIAVLFRGRAEGLSAVSFAPSTFLSGAPGIGLMFAVAGFIGFESTAIFRSGARDPDRTIPRATYVAVLLIGVFYAFSSWSLVMAWGPDNVVAAAEEDPAGMIMATAQNYLGSWGSVTINVLLITSLFACILQLPQRSRALSVHARERRRPAPAAGLIGLIGILVAVVTYFATLIGGSQGLANAFVALVVAALVIGVVQALMIRRRSPERYADLTAAISG